MDLQLTGKTALVTGGSKGTGAAIARELSLEGCRVAITSRTKEDLEAVAAEITKDTGNEVITLPGDWRKWDDVQAVVGAAIEHFGVLDIFVPNAGDAPGGLFERMNEEDWERGLSLKLMGHMRGLRAVLPHMAERRAGAIVMVVGNDGLKPPYGEIIPGACNAADINVASALAQQYGYKGIRINTVNPGPIATDRWWRAEKTVSEQRNLSPDQVRKVVLASLPPGYICTPKEVARVVVFLASPCASYVNGANVPVDGAQQKTLMHVDEFFDVNL
jgi:Dehydrogenases with different specificities (related to short-chain alcohol dehydrogenases)